jgi:hypothetical protein
MIFARRAIQNCLNELRAIIGDEATRKLADRMNKPGKDRLAAMWEVVTFHGLSKLGTLQHEIPLETGRKPDISFKSKDLEITADVRAVSDDGLHEKYPAQRLSDLLHEEQTRLGLPLGRLDLRIDQRQQSTSRGVKTGLCLPESNRLPQLVRELIAPKLKQQIEKGAGVLHVSIKNETTSLQITIDPRKAPYSSMSHALYTAPSIRDKNPLYEALKAKGRQLRGAPGIVGVIVGDSATRTLAEPMTGSTALTGRAIAEEFLRQHRSVSFVLLISVREEQHAWYKSREREMQLKVDLVSTAPDEVSAKLENLFKSMLDNFPKPVNTPINASYRAKENSFGLGYHGGFSMSGNRIKVSAREVLEVLSGRCTVEEINKKHDEITMGRPSGPNTMPRLMELYLEQGRMPSKITLIKTDENESDNWLEFEFGPPDPAITPFR